MTTVTPQPMRTPDLAGLLSKPRRPPTPAAVEPPAVDDAQPPAPEDDRRQSAVVHAQADVAPPAAPAESADEAPSTPAPKPRARATAGAPAAAAPTRSDPPPVRQYLRSIGVYLPRAVHQRLSAQADRDGTTRTALILAAVNATHERLDEFLAADDTTDGNPGDLFDVPQRRARPEPTMQTSIRVSDAQLEALDRLAATHATNRSRILTAALTGYLPPA